jgi:hypothetical protein
VRELPARLIHTRHLNIINKGTRTTWLLGSSSRAFSNQKIARSTCPICRWRSPRLLKFRHGCCVLSENKLRDSISSPSPCRSKDDWSMNYR